MQDLLYTKAILIKKIGNSKNILSLLLILQEIPYSKLLLRWYVMDMDYEQLTDKQDGHKNNNLRKRNTI